MLKPLIHPILVFASVISSHFCISTALAAPAEILYLLDASGSMNELNGDAKRIDVAKKAITASLQKLPQGTPVGFRVFAHRVSKSDKEASCKDSQLVAPISSERTGAISMALEVIQPKGFTPLAYSIALAGDDFKKAEKETQKSIILLSDGEETCGGDPTGEIKRLKDRGIEVKVYAIGFDVDAQSRLQLEQLAESAGGKYFDAKNQSQLIAALREATDKSLILEKKAATVYGTELRGGDSFESALPITTTLFEKELRLDHHQKSDEYDYFSFHVKAGQAVTVTVKTLEKGVSISKDGKVSSGSAAGALVIHGPDRTKIGSIHESGSYRTQSESFSVAKEGTYYLRVGAGSGWSLSKDGFTFQISIPNVGDINGEDDAPEFSTGALAISPGVYEKNFIGGADKRDTFVFTAQSGESYVVKLIPADGATGAYLKLKVINELKQQIASAGAKNFSEGFKSEPIKITETGKYYLQIEDTSSRQLNQYLLELQKIDIKS
jgi:hypothetical protein